MSKPKLSVSTITKGVNLLTTLCSTNKPKRKNQLYQLKKFQKAHGLTRGEWAFIRDTALSRFPQRMSQLPKEK